MTKEKLEEIIKQGEGLEVAFKTAAFELSKDTFDSICGFLNRMGGHLLLGVNDNGKIEGVIDPENFSPFPKNPVIAKFFHEIGRVDELGSGIRNTFRYGGIYTPGSKPAFIEGDVFKTIIPLKIREEKSAISSRIQADAVNDAVNDAVKSRLKRELVFIIIQSGISINELRTQFNIERATAQRDMKLLKTTGWVNFVGSPKTGKYQLTNTGEIQFQKFVPDKQHLPKKS